ncbi:MAG: MBL fold metallo-hydrolase [Gammaproteobacteria bacterium]|nr:MBL fold metallo-hydrolase [Gammaproteobacteria bacterium]
MKSIARNAVLFLAAAASLSSSLAIAQDGASDGTITTETHRFQMLADGVYLAMYTVPMFNSNSLVVINDEDVLVVDSHITPRAAKQLLAGIAEITDKPITTLVYTHFHYDHAHGTQAFGDVQIIGHEFTRKTMAGDPHNEPTFQREKAGQPRAIAWLESQLESATSDEQREQLEYRLGLARARAEATKGIEPVPPDTTLTDRLDLIRGDREIQVIFCGRAHTGGDVVVYLPADKLVYTGDMAFSGPSFLGDGHVDEWPDTLMKLKELDVELYVPGHGPPFTDSGRLDLVADYYRVLWKQVVAARADGANAGEATSRVDLTSFADTLGIRRPGTDPLAVARIYQLLDERGD